MLYSIIGFDTDNSLEKRLSARPDHVARLVSLKDQGRLLLAGPNPVADGNDPGETGFSGSVIIAEFESLSQAQEWANNDPYVKTGVYAKVMVKPFKKVLP